MPALEQDVAVTKLKPNPRNNKSMFQIFQNVQFNVVQHKKYVKEMTKLYRQLSEQDFRESFKNALHYLFTFGDTSANVDRVVQFVATFCTSLDDEEEFLLFIFDIIFSCQCVSGQSVRYRASQLLAAVLSALGDDASLDDDLCEKLLASQMQRLQDTRGAVRCRAALALQRLQNPMESDDEVTRAYRFHMSCDPSSSVRRAVVMSIAKCSRNVPFVLERLCDVDEAVRRAAFLYIGAINVTQLRVRQRLLTLKVGLTERSTRVRRVVEEILIPGWLSSFKGNIIDLLKAIRLDNAHDANDSEMVAGKLLESLFKRLPISELLEWLPTDKSLRLIPPEKLNKETAWYWRHLALHLQKTDDDETLETVLPDLVVLIGYIKAIVESPCPDESADPVSFSIRQSVLHELGMLLQAYDAGDQAGRTALQELVSNVLTGDHGYLSPKVISSFVDALTLVMPQQSLRMEAISGIISQLREPEMDLVQDVVLPVESGEVKLQRARLRVSLNVAMEAQEEAVREQNYALAEECKAKVKDIQRKLEEMNTKPPTPPPVPVQPTIREKICDPDTLNKCLLILNSALNSPDITSVTPMMQMIFNDLEVEIFQNPDVSENALETVALYGMLNKEFAKENKAFFFANLIDTSNERIVCIVLKCLVDLLCVHGARLFEDEESKDVSNQSLKKKRITMDIGEEDGTLSESLMSMTPNHSTVIELLLKIMDSTCSTYRLIIVEGLCKLFTLGHLESASILSRLLLLWFNPATVDEDMLRQIIGVFFQSFASNVEGAQEQIQKATIPTLRALANAPSSSPLAEIDQEAIVRFIVSLTRVHHESSDSEASLALIICNYISSRSQCECVPLACRLLSLLHAPRDTGLCNQMAKVIPGILEKLQDKQSSRNLTRYLGVLEAASRTSINKMTNIDGTMQSEDNTMGKISRITTSLQNTTLQSEDNTIGRFGRMTSSLPHPIARSTHVVINDTVPEEEIEIDETSPNDVVSRISEEHEQSTKLSDIVATPKQSIESRSSEVDSIKEATESNSDRDVSPPKKPKVVKGKKKLSTNKKGAKEKQDKEKKSPGGLKRSRSQRSVVDIDRAQQKKEEQKAKLPPAELDSSNVTIRRSVRPIEGSSSGESVNSKNSKKGAKKNGKETAPKRITRQSSEMMSSPLSSRGSTGSLFENSADETELHTIVYEQEMVQSLLEDSIEGANTKLDNVTIAQTPESSEIESEPETTKQKSKKNVKGKKKCC